MQPACVLAALSAVAAAPAAAAGLNEHCVVSVLNRSSYVQADGSWVLPNIPSNVGRVRARATCVEDGVTRSGQSDWFVVPPNGIVKVPEIRFDAAGPVPSRLALRAPVSTLASVNATVQLTATATYPDGRTADVAGSSRGTNYTSSNPAIASVSEQGLVTARASGVVILTALNDGASGLVRVSVVLSGDSDGDGIPDDVELANGLDPRNPVDALEDFDRDGLANGEELRLGTDIRSADSDGDTLVDGREVAIGTDPLVLDTDGDGISDGLELGTGSDPLDPASYSLAQALGSIEVSPGSVVLVVNTLLGEASRQVRVTGRLRDGRTIDLTSARRGTRYASSDLTVASFGVVDGLVFAGSDGHAVVTVSNSGFQATAQVTVTSFAPGAVSFLQIPGFANNVDVALDHAFVAAGPAGLQVVDVVDRASPRIAGSLDTPGDAQDVVVAGRLAFVADGPAGLQVIDVSDPASPRLLGSLGLPGASRDVVVRGSRAYLACGAGGLAVVDVADPARPVLLGSLASEDAWGVDAGGSLAVVADGRSLRVVDVGDPAAPALRGTLTGLASARDVALEGTFAYVADGQGSLKIVDVSIPTAPRLTATIAPEIGGMLNDVVKVGGFAFGADFFFVNGVPIVDVGDPFAPQVRARLDFPPGGNVDGTGIAVDNSFVYLTAQDGVSRLYIGRYLTLADEAGVPPTLTISSPADGSEHYAGATVNVTADARDDVAVAAVTFGVDGVPVSTDSTAPFGFSYTFRADVSSVTFTATAIDFGGNVGEAVPLTVLVVPKPPPTITLTSPAEGAALFGGQTITIEAAATDTVSVRRIGLTVNGVALAERLFDQPAATFHVAYTIPLGTTELVVTASVTDGAGLTTSTTRSLGVGLSPLPSVVFQSPVPVRDLLFEGQGTTLRVLALSPLRIRRIELTANGALVAAGQFDLTGVVYTADYLIPLGTRELVLVATATDSLGQTASATQTFEILPVPRTTVIGRVVDGRDQPVSGVAVRAFNGTTRTSPDGSFTIPGVAAVNRVSVCVETAGGVGACARATPDGITDVGSFRIGSVMRVGYFDLRGFASPAQVPPIEKAGMAPVEIERSFSRPVFENRALGDMDILFVDNPDNSGHSGAERAGLSHVFDWISRGGVLVFHDYAVTGAEAVLPGSPGRFVRPSDVVDDPETRNVDIVDGTTAVTDGPGGVLDNLSLDDGNRSNHGFVAADSIPPGARGILARSNPGELVLYAYPYGHGWVVYATIPLAFYLENAPRQPSVNQAFHGVYAPNVLAFARDLLLGK